MEGCIKHEKRKAFIGLTFAKFRVEKLQNNNCKRNNLLFSLKKINK